MLRQELQTTKETLAARDAELQELKSRVAELERLQADQQKLIALKDAELTSAQNRAGETAAAQAEVPSGNSALPWIAGGALVLLGLLAAAWARRARRAPDFRSAPAGRPSVADALAGAPDAPAPRSDATVDSQAAATALGPAPVAVATHDEPAIPAEPPAVALPSWERGGSSPRRASPAPAPRAPTTTPAWASGDTETLTPQVEPANAERLELAQAYLDMGDRDRARQLLAEVEASDDATARGVASRMRQGIG
jgi:pilus assembly protein FimV